CHSALSMVNCRFSPSGNGYCGWHGSPSSGHTVGAHGLLSSTLQVVPPNCAWATVARPAQQAAPPSTAYRPSRRIHPHFMSAATCTLAILSGFSTGSPRLILSTTFMPDTTSPITVYWPLSPDASLNMMKNWLLAELGSPLRAMPTMPRLNGTCENSAGTLGYFEPPVPLNFSPSPVCAMKPSITRWNGTLS